MSLPHTFVPGFHDEEAVKKMPYTKLGQTSINISKLGFGGASVSGFYGEFEKNEALETIVDAIKNGINYIDTAPYYGERRSETIIGEALKKVPREAYYLSTKVGRYTTQWDTMFDYSPEKITSGLEKSLQLLGIDYVDILVVHDIEFADMNQIMNETLPCIKKLVDIGKVKYIAVSAYPVDILWETICRSPVHIDVVITYSRDTLFDKTLYDFMPKFKSKDVGLINAAPTGLALLTNAGPQAWHPATTQLKQLCSEAAQYCKENGVELARLAVQHALKNELCENLLVGNNNKNLLQSNLQLVSSGLTPKEQKILDIIYQKYFPLNKSLHWEGVELEMYKQSKGLK